MFKKFLVTILCAGTCIYGWNDEPECYKELQVDFFRSELVSQTMSLYSLTQSSWQMIVYELQKRSREKVPDIIHYKASRMRPNPLEYPFNPKIASQILFDTLFDLLKEVFRGYNIFQQFNDTDYKGMFNEIKRKQRDRLRKCFGDDYEEPPESEVQLKRK